MPVFHLDIPLEWYFRLLDGESLDPAGKERLAEAVAAHPDVRVFGASTTGRAFKAVLGGRFASFVDSNTLDPDSRGDHSCVVVGASPAHYGDILRVIKAKCPCPDPLVILPFSTVFDDPVRIILETQPRSATTYVMGAILGSGRFSYATMFENELQGDAKRYIQHNGVFFEADGSGRKYAVKSHFFSVVPCPEHHRNAATIRLISFIMDAYYLWGRMLRSKGSSQADAGYRLVESSPEWLYLKNQIYVNKQWLNSLPKSIFFRYEDFALRHSETVEALCKAIGCDCRASFTPFKTPVYRSYFTEDYLGLMDADVFRFLWREFADTIADTHPEKLPSLERTAAALGG